MLDPCFTTKTCNQEKGAPHGIAAVLVDCTLMTRNKQFAKAEERSHSNYDIGQAQTITNGSQIKLGGVQIGRDLMVHCVYHIKLTLKTYQCPSYTLLACAEPNP
jgi:hypothetical protein